MVKKSKRRNKKQESTSQAYRLVHTEDESDFYFVPIDKFGNEMDDVPELNKDGSIRRTKEEKLVDLVNNMVDLNENGLSTLDISKNLNELGIKTVNLSIELDKRKEMESWSKEQWADSYKGSILTSSGEQVITDKEIKGKVTELENKLISISFL